MNQANPNIKFTSAISDHQIPFLDTLVKVSDNSIVTDLYTKPTDSHSYLHYNSAHPHRCKKGIPYSQFLRLRRICSDIKDYKSHVLTLCDFFLQRNYPENLLSEAACQVLQKDRTTLLTQSSNPRTKRQQTKNDKAVLISTFHPTLQPLPRIVHRNWDMLDASSSTLPLHRRKLVCGFRRPPNLRRLLTKAKVPRLNRPIRPANVTSPSHPGLPSQGDSQSVNTPHPKHCLSQGRCRYCPILNRTGFITSRSTKIAHRCMKNITCNTHNIVYAITCKRCQIQYVGHTSGTIKGRFKDHFLAITNKVGELPVPQHFNSFGHNGIQDVSISVLEFIRKPAHATGSAGIRQRVENNWIQTLRTRKQQGLNREDPKPYTSRHKN